jgi:signal transduction histidine kinase
MPPLTTEFPLVQAINNGKPVPDLIQSNGIAMPLQGFSPHLNWCEMGASEHFVQFYETDTFLLNSVSGFISTGLNAGDGAIVVATREHREDLEKRLRERGLDVAAAQASGQYVVMDAAEALSKFMVDGLPEPKIFVDVMGDIIARAAQGRRQVRIFGEMVALLWEKGNVDAAIRLEQLWNDLHKSHSFSLFCAYPMNGFGREALAGPLCNVCAEHSRIIPAESYTELTNPDDRLRAIALMQQKAITLQSEMVERQEVEGALRAVRDELEVQVEDLRRLHEMSLSLTSTLDIESVLQEVLRSAMALQGTDMGLLSLCVPDCDYMHIEVSNGFPEQFLQIVDRVSPGAGACGACYQQRRRVVVEDVESDPLFMPYLDLTRMAGFRACNSTPLITRRGTIIGVLGLYFPQPHRPSERETRLMDLYASIAADFIENAQLHHQVQQELEEREQLLVREQEARAEAESANRLKDEFLATISHELRTPLTAIIGWTSMLRNGRFDEATTSRGLQTIERNANSQAQLIEDMLDVSRVITGSFRLNIGAVDLATVINAAIDSLQLASEAKNIQVVVTLDPSARHISGDSSRLQQVVWNLVSNAIKFTPSDGRIEVRLERADSDAQIQVSDTGQGISQEFLPFIFDRFRQANSTDCRKHGGLGLGLAIVRHLIELHGGTVSADSPGQGCGATLTVRLPLTMVHERTKMRGSAAEKRCPYEDTAASQ